MPKISDLFTKIKSSIIGTATSKIDRELDKVNKEILSHRSDSGRAGYIELVKSVISRYGEVSNLQNINSFSGNQTPASFGQSARLYRYKSYEAIVSNISYCYRALNVLVDNILSPDDISKKSLDIKLTSFTDDSLSNSKLDIVKDIIKNIKLENYLDLIISNTLKFGDFFCEIVDSKSVFLNKSYLMEQNENNFLQFNHEDQKFLFNIDFSSLNENKKESKLKSTKITFHNPQSVVKLQTESFPICFGYLIFPNVSTTGVQSQFPDHLINNICQGILKNVEEKIPEIKSIKNKKELKELISSVISESNPEGSIDLRFVPEYRMQHFSCMNSLKYFPYGESIFDSSQFLAKVLISLETALTIQRLSRSTEKRKITYELGLPRDARKAIEQIKEKIRKRKISIDSLGTIDTIPSMVTTFEDIYIPSRDGKPFVDINTFTEGNVDTATKTEELKFMRDSLIASLGVPPSFIGIEENQTLRNTLSEENILFTRTVIKHQKYISLQISSLIQKLVSITHPEESLTLLDDIIIALPTPKSLQNNLMATHMNDTISLIESLERIGVPKEWSKKKFLPDIDWDEIEHFEIEKEMDKTISPPEEGEVPGPTGF